VYPHVTVIAEPFAVWEQKGVSAAAEETGANPAAETNPAAARRRRRRVVASTRGAPSLTERATNLAP
jgi:hypothetical protein